MRAGAAAARDNLSVSSRPDGLPSPAAACIARFLVAAGESRPTGDRAGVVVVFATKAMVDRFPDDGFRGGEVLARPAPEAADLAAAVRLARGLFPPG